MTPSSKSDLVRRKTLYLPDPDAHYVEEVAFRSRGKITQSDVLCAAVREYRKTHPLLDSAEEKKSFK